jgi:hypothetical protein
MGRQFCVGRAGLSRVQILIASSSASKLFPEQFGDQPGLQITEL